MTLKDYLEKNKMTTYQFAKEIRLPQRQVYRYFKQESVPRPDVMNIIYYATKKKVTPNDFFKPDLIAYTMHMNEKK